MTPTTIANLLPNYQRASSRWPDAPMLSEYYIAINECISGTRHGVVEHVKSFIDSVCLTILGEMGNSLTSSNPTSGELFALTLKSLGLENTRGASKLDKVLSSFRKLYEALGEMRNENGPVAHGKDGFLDAIEQDHARAFLHTGDAIVGVLLNALEGKQPNLHLTREPYERFKHLCERIDRSVDIDASVDRDESGAVLVVSLTLRGRPEAVELRIEPSRLLYGVDRAAFIGVLAESPEPTRFEEEPEEDVELDDGAESTLMDSSPLLIPTAVTVSNAQSRQFTDLHERLRSFLSSIPNGPEPTDALLTSILATAEVNSGADWQTREGILARMRVGLKRLFKSQEIVAHDLAEKLVDWLKSQVQRHEERR